MCTHYLLDIRANHVFNILNNTLWLTLCQYQQQRVFHIKGETNVENVNEKVQNKWVVEIIPIATFVRPGKSINVKLTTAKQKDNENSSGKSS